MKGKPQVLCAALLVSALMLSALPAAAWGPTTQVTIVSTAASLVSRTGEVRFDRTLRDLQAGAAVPMQQLRELYPDLDTSPVNAIETEMHLLSAVKGDRITPYFAYRLGILGKLVAEVTSPLQQTSPTHRNLYFADVDRVIGAINLQPAPRQEIDTRPYFARVFTEAAVNDELIEREYQAGEGISGLSRGMIGRDVSRSVSAAADVMYTVVTRSAVAAGVSDRQLRSYVLGGYEYYIRRGNTQEIASASERLERLANLTPEMRERVGDLFFDAGMHERAMEEYQAVLQQAPERRDVVEKMARYYVRQGEQAFEADRYEQALESFEQALEANPLDPRAEGLRLQAQRQLSDREARQQEARESLQRAVELEALADQEAQARRYAEAIEFLRQALHTYDQVSDEFTAELQERRRGEERAHTRIRTYKQDLIANARIYSGTGYTLDAQRHARENLDALNERALRDLIRQEYQAQLSALESALQGP